MQTVKIGRDDRAVLGLYAQRMARAALSQQPNQEDRRLDGHAEHLQGPLDRHLHGSAERALEAPHEQLDSVASHPSIVSCPSWVRHGTTPAQRLCPFQSARARRPIAPPTMTAGLFHRGQPAHGQSRAVITVHYHLLRQSPFVCSPDVAVCTCRRASTRVPAISIGTRRRNRTKQAGRFGGSMRSPC